MAKFFVGQRVRIKQLSCPYNGLEAVITSMGPWRYGDILFDGEVMGEMAYDVRIEGVGEVDDMGYGFAYSANYLEPITDTWAQDKVAQLVKQCMPVAA